MSPIWSSTQSIFSKRGISMPLANCKSKITSRWLLIFWSTKNRQLINRLTRISQNAFQSLKHQKIKCRCFRTLKQYSLFILSHTNLFRCSNTRNHKFKSKLSFKIVNQASDLIRPLPASQLETNRIKGFPTFFVCLKWKLSKRLKVLMRLLQRHNKM